MPGRSLGQPSAGRGEGMVRQTAPVHSCSCSHPQQVCQELVPPYSPAMSKHRFLVSAFKRTRVFWGTLKPQGACCEEVSKSCPLHCPLSVCFRSQCSRGGGHSRGCGDQTGQCGTDRRREILLQPHLVFHRTVLAFLHLGKAVRAQKTVLHLIVLVKC